MTAQRLSLPRLVQVALAATIVLVVLASSSVHALERVGSPTRWVALTLFAGLAVLWARAERGDVGRLLPVLLPSAFLAALAFVSALWSVAPTLTLQRALSFFVMLAGVAALASVARAEFVARIVAEAVVIATTLVCFAGTLVYAFVPAEAAQLTRPTVPFRWAGLGQNPNTVQLLAALAALPAAWLAIEGSRRRRAAFGTAFVVLCAQVIASGSRDGAIGVAAGAFVFAVVSPAAGRARLARIGAACVLTAALVGGVAAMDLTAPPLSNAPSPQPVAKTSAPPPAPAGAHPRVVLPGLDYEFGTLEKGPRSFLVGGGRGQAIREGINQANERPIAGWGFGTEARVFINRVAMFRSQVVEDTYVGLYLQLGVLGPVLWLLIGIATCWVVLRSRRRLGVAALAGAAAAGYALGVGQSYVYAVGNVGTLTFWLAIFLAVALAAPRYRIGMRAATSALVAASLVLTGVALAGRSERASRLNSARAGIDRIWERVGARVDGRGVDGFREFHPIACLIYAADGTPTAYELCFVKGETKSSLVEAIDRRHGFQVWTLRPFGAAGASIVVPTPPFERLLAKLGANDPTVVRGPGYLAPGR